MQSGGIKIFSHLVPCNLHAGSMRLPWNQLILILNSKNEALKVTCLHLYSRPIIPQWNADCLCGFRCAYCVNVNSSPHKVPLKLCASGAKIPYKAQLIYPYSASLPRTESCLYVCVGFFFLSRFTKMHKINTIHAHKHTRARAHTHTHTF